MGAFPILDTLLRPWKEMIRGYIRVLGKYGDSGADVSVNTDQSPEKMGSNMDRRPKAGGPYWTPISKDEVRIHRYVQARVTVFTL